MIVVADTSVLLNLCCIDQVDLLPHLFQEVLIPPEVDREFTGLAARDPRFAGLKPPQWIRIQTAKTTPAALLANSGLDLGESAALALALEIKADAILIDERLGHEAATRLGLVAIGLLGVLLRAKHAGHLATIAPELTRLQEKAGFWLSDPVRRRVLQLAGEGS